MHRFQPVCIVLAWTNIFDQCSRKSSLCVQNGAEYFDKYAQNVYWINQIQGACWMCVCVCINVFGDLLDEILLMCIIQQLKHQRKCTENHWTSSVLICELTPTNCWQRSLDYAIQLFMDCTEKNMSTYWWIKMEWDTVTTRFKTWISSMVLLRQCPANAWLYAQGIRYIDPDNIH